MKNAILIVLGIIIFLIILIWLLGRHKKIKKKKKHNDIFRKANQSSIMNNEKDRDTYSNLEKDNIILKIQMYIISLWLLFILIIPITLNWDSVNADSLKQRLLLILENNILPVLCLGMAILGMVFYRQLKYRWKGTRNLSVKVDKVESENYEYLTFFTTYIIPLVCINLDETRYVIVLFVLLFVIGIIFIKSDFYLGNPTLALVNYKLYRIQYKINDQDRERLVITKEKINQGDYVEAIPFDEKTWFVRRSSRE